MSLPWRHEKFCPGDWVAVNDELAGQVVRWNGRQIVDYGDGNGYIAFYVIDHDGGQLIAMGTTMRRISLLERLAWASK